jgi:hypothetical protein
LHFPKFSDVLKLQADYWQKLFNAFQDEEFRNWPFEAGEPRTPVIQDKSAKRTCSPGGETKEIATERVGPFLQRPLMTPNLARPTAHGLKTMK